MHQQQQKIKGWYGVKKSLNIKKSKNKLEFKLNNLPFSPSHMQINKYTTTKKY